MNTDILNVWGEGQILAFSGLDGSTDFNNGLVLRTAFNKIGFDIKLPENGGNIKIKNFNENIDTLTLAGDFFHFGSTKGVFIDTWHLLLEGDVQVETGDSVKILCADNRILIGAKEYFCPELLEKKINEVISERKNSLHKFPVPENLPENARRTLWKAYSQLRTQFCSPEGIIKKLWTTPDRWPHRRMWLWDSVFHAVGIRHLNVKAARETISAMLKCIRDDGFMPLDANPQIINNVTQPPLLALGVKLIQEVEADPPELLRKGQNIPDSFFQSFHDFGWSATLYIDFVFEKFKTK